MEFTRGFPEGDWKLYVFDKPKQLIEHVNEDPYYVLAEVFERGEWDYNDKLRDWLIIGFQSDLSVFDDWGARITLIYFCDSLRLLIEALFIIYSRHLQNTDQKEEKQAYTIRLLTKEQKEEPQKVIIAFFKYFPDDYIKKELDDWLEAGLGNQGQWRENIDTPWQVLNTYRHILCFVECSRELIKFLK